MAKRIAVKSTGKGAYSGLAGLAVGTKFKAVEYTVKGCENYACVKIRGTSLAKATGHKTAFIHKQYIFVLGLDNSGMEIDHDDS